jgi:ERCC4-related helicase
MTNDVVLSPRLYQAHLIEKAKQGNVIVVLDTGTGKVGLREINPDPYFG